MKDYPEALLIYPEVAYRFEILSFHTPENTFSSLELCYSDWAVLPDCVLSGLSSMPQHGTWQRSKTLAIRASQSMTAPDSFASKKTALAALRA
jgi:hypothetical protein